MLVKSPMTAGKVRRLEMRISGRVQGVFFRDATRRTARALGLGGVVRNVQDGSVHVIAEGNEEALRQLRAFCQKGPPSAVVQSVEESWKEPTGSFDDFDVTF
jgi:acylphosphatase